MALTKRVPVLLSPEEYGRLKEISRKKKTPMGELIRAAVKKAYEAEAGDRKMEAFKKLRALELDLPEWETLEEEIIRGKLVQ